MGSSVPSLRPPCRPRRFSLPARPFRSRLLLFAVLLLLLGLRPARAANGAEALNHYALAFLNDEAIASRIALRFKALGKPVFLIHNVRTGLGQGDLMRFKDKAVLIDADVWQTLRVEGALQKLEVSPMVRVQARAEEGTWLSRSNLVTSPREKKAYQLGAELVKVLEQNFGGVPKGEQVSLVFEGSNLVLLAPAPLLDQLRVQPVRREPPGGAPRFVSPPPRSPVFTGQPFFWQPFAADPAEPEAALRYALKGDLPPGLEWDAKERALKGSPRTAGEWRLGAEVRNPKGALDTLLFTLRVRANVAPLLGREPARTLLAGRPFSFEPRPLDRDHESSQLRILPDTLPAGMDLTAEGEFRFTPPESLAGRSAAFAFRVQDPLGAETRFSFPLKILPPAALLSTEGFRLELPEDTLRQGRLYEWKPAALGAASWEAQGLRLVQVTGAEEASFDGQVLRLRPRNPGSFPLTFLFSSGRDTVAREAALWVTQNRPPRFESELSSPVLPSGVSRRSGSGAASAAWAASASYKPVAVDPEGDSVSYTAVAGEAFGWDGRRLHLLPGAGPGTHAAEILAVDAKGGESRQFIAWTLRDDRHPRRLFLEQRIQRGIVAYDLTFEFGSGRLGLFTPDPKKALALEPLSDKVWPFLYAGGNLLGVAQEKKGNRLLADLGFNLRVPDIKLAVGGLFTRVKSEWAYAEGARAEIEVLGWAKQAILLADTSGYRLRFMPDGRIESSERFQNLLEEVFDEATAKDNVVVFTRVENWHRLGLGFWGGLHLMREDVPMAREYFQRLGLGLRHDLGLGGFSLRNTLRGGYGPGGAGWSLSYTARAGFSF